MAQHAKVAPEPQTSTAAPSAAPPAAPNAADNSSVDTLTEEMISDLEAAFRLFDMVRMCHAQGPAPAYAVPPSLWWARGIHLSCVRFAHALAGWQWHYLKE